jgi:hypothetical protein
MRKFHGRRGGRGGRGRKELWLGGSVLFIRGAVMRSRGHTGSDKDKAQNRRMKKLIFQNKSLIFVLNQFKSFGLAERGI